MDEITTLLLGNTAVVEVRTNEDPKTGERLPDERIDRSDLGNRTTTVRFPQDVPLDTRVQHVRELWPYHSDADGPEWVESDDDPLLAELVARNFTTETHTCTVGRPKGWKEDEA